MRGAAKISPVTNPISGLFCGTAEQYEPAVVMASSRRIHPTIQSTISVTTVVPWWDHFSNAGRLYRQMMYTGAARDVWAISATSKVRRPQTYIYIYTIYIGDPLQMLVQALSQTFKI